MPTTALIAAGVGAAGAIGGSLIQSNAASKAADEQANSQRAALAQQQALFNQGLGVQSNYVNQAQGTLNPFISLGQGAGNTLSGLLTPGNSAADLAQMPGFQFASQYGTKAATNALAARGQGASAGPLATAISQYNNGLAGQQYFNTVGALQNLTNTGANAATSLSGIFGNAGNAALGASTQQAGLQGNSLSNIGNAQASGTLGSANALAGGLTGASNAGTNALLFSALGQGGSNGLYSADALANGPSNSAISNMSNAQAAQYEGLFG